MKTFSFPVIALAGLLSLAGTAVRSPAQSSGMPVHSLDGLADEDRFKAAAEKLRVAGRVLCAAARAAHLRIGWYYRCTKRDDWHLDLAGG